MDLHDSRVGAMSSPLLHDDDQRCCEGFFRIRFANALVFWNPFAAVGAIMSDDVASIVINDSSVIIGDSARVDITTTRAVAATTTSSAAARGRPSGRFFDKPLVITMTTRAEFPWLEVDEKGQHYCALCAKHGADPTKKDVRAANNWIEPKDASVVRNYRYHAAAICHTAAVRYEETAKKNQLQNGLKIAQEKSFANLRTLSLHIR